MLSLLIASQEVRRKCHNLFVVFMDMSLRKMSHEMSVPMHMHLLINLNQLHSETLQGTLIFSIPDKFMFHISTLLKYMNICILLTPYNS